MASIPTHMMASIPTHMMASFPLISKIIKLVFAASPQSMQH
jgi:hypothetical protein